MVKTKGSNKQTESELITENQIETKQSQTGRNVKARNGTEWNRTERKRTIRRHQIKLRKPRYKSREWPAPAARLHVEKRPHAKQHIQPILELRIFCLGVQHSVFECSSFLYSLLISLFSSNEDNVLIAKRNSQRKYRQTQQALMLVLYNQLWRSNSHLSPEPRNHCLRIPEKGSRPA